MQLRQASVAATPIYGLPEAEYDVLIEGSSRPEDEAESGGP